MELMTAHRQWATRPADERYKTMDELLKAVQSRQSRSMAANIAVGGIEPRVDAENLVLTLGDMGATPAAPTHWSFGQVCRALRAPTDWLRTCPPELAVRNMEFALTKLKEGEEMKAMVVASEDGSVNTLQAVTSTTYGRIWDADVVAAVAKMVDRTDGKFHNPPAYDPMGMGGEPLPSGLYASDRDCFMFMIDGGSKLEMGERMQLNKGFIVWNSEVGSRSYGMMTFLFNECCGNHIIWGAQDINKLIIRHTQGGPTRFEREAVGILTEFTNAEVDRATLDKAARTTLDSVLSVPDEKVLSEVWQKTFADKYNFTRGELREGIAAAEREEGRCHTLWDMVQGLTEHARRFEHVDTRLNLETRAGNLLNIIA